MAAVQVSRNAGNIKKIDFLMSPDRDLPPRPGGASFRYVLCSTPRSGSNLISDMLRATQLAGDPAEYFNTRYIAGYLRQQGKGESNIDLGRYQADLETRRTSPNGVFGTKVHFEHIDTLWRDNLPGALRFFRGYDRFILLSRRDKLAQALSFYRARETQIWSSLDYQFLEPDDPKLGIVPVFEPARITRALADLVEQEARWRMLIEAMGVPFVEVFYEDVVDDFQGQSHRVLTALDIDPSQAHVAAPRLKRQGSDNDPMAGELRAFLGIDPPGRPDGQ